MTAKRQAHKNVNVASWMFGHPVLRADNNSKAQWSSRTASPYYQKGGGWLAELIGGVQTGDDWAAIYIPVNELPVQAFDAAKWSYYMTTADGYGVNMVIWVHDGEDPDKRAEITQQGDNAGLARGAGWNAHKWNIDTTQMFYFGENVPGTTQLTSGTQYKWSQFQADPLFKDWYIYRVSIEFGWRGSGTFGTASVAEVLLNEIPIPLLPSVTGSQRRTVPVQKTMIADAKAAGDVYSENATTGTDWDFDFGGTGYITKGVIVHDAQMSERFVLYLFSQPPT
ncbi:hypothetical protein LCGC14_3028210, partial [marine sediment metagenome]